MLPLSILEIEPGMATVLLFAGTLVVAVVVSERANRSVLSTAVLFLGVGFVAGSGVTGLLEVEPAD